MSKLDKIEGILAARKVVLETMKWYALRLGPENEIKAQRQALDDAISAIDDLESEVRGA